MKAFLILNTLNIDNMIAILITAYNRAEPLSTLLNSLLAINTDGDIIPLIISIDNNGTPDVNRIAESFVWPYGPKEVIVHREKKGLVNHFIWTGDQTERFENVIFLEDDLFVSPEMYHYTKQLIDFYKDKDEVAAASLYNPILMEATGTRFYQIEDGYDAYFFQQPYWGHVWFRDKWRKFKDYLNVYKINPDIIPHYIASWEKSFKKIFVQFLVETGRTVVTPRVSLVTNNGVPGLHSSAMFQYQSPLFLGGKNYSFPELEKSRAKYDSFFELEPYIVKTYNDILKEYDFEMDVNGIRTKYTKEYVLTTRMSKAPICQFSSLMKPTELGCILNNKGLGLCLSRSSDVVFDKKYEKQRRYKDISKNYYIGYFASVQIAKDLLKMIFNRIVHR